MKTNNPLLPEELFDWLEGIPFPALDPKQQNRVLEFFSEEEYTSMHRAASGLRYAAKATRPKGKEQVKNELRHAFEEKHGKRNKIIVLLNQPVRLGVAAAITLFLLTGLLWQNLSRTPNPVQVELPVRIDTVLVELRTAPVVVHDTVLIPFTPKKWQAYSRIPSQIRANEQELYISGAEDLSAPINQQKGVSLQTDSLVGKFGFVSM